MGNVIERLEGRRLFSVSILVLLPPPPPAGPVPIPYPNVVELKLPVGSIDVTKVITTVSPVTLE